jgi:hypothetical protein
MLAPEAPRSAGFVESGTVRHGSTTHVLQASADAARPLPPDIVAAPAGAGEAILDRQEAVGVK